MNQSIHGIQPPSKLQAIIDQGLARIDAAIERVCDSFVWIMPTVQRCLICEKVQPDSSQWFCVDIGCSGPVHTDCGHIPEEHLIKVNIELGPWLYAGQYDVNREAQKLNNLQAAEMAKRAVLAKPFEFNKIPSMYSIIDVSNH